jgi:DNA-binding GntR family transcriptional regulator
MADDIPDASPDEARALQNAIARDIHDGFWEPGSWLKQIALQARYGRSRGDVRRALDKLVAQRLVQQVHNFGYRVREVDDAWLLEMRQLRTVLEVAAAELMLGRAGPAEIAHLRALAAAFGAAGDDLLRRNEANLAFHHALLELCPNRELARLVAETRLRMPSAPLTQWHEPGWIDESDRHHKGMVEALAAGDGAAFLALVRAHIRTPTCPPREAMARRRRRTWPDAAD